MRRHYEVDRLVLAGAAFEVPVAPQLGNTYSSGLGTGCRRAAEAADRRSKQLDLDAGLIGALDAVTLRDVIKAIGYVIESDCEPV
jgi:hypothetical protein